MQPLLPFLLRSKLLLKLQDLPRGIPERLLRRPKLPLQPQLLIPALHIPQVHLRRDFRRLWIPGQPGRHLGRGEFRERTQHRDREEGGVRAAADEEALVADGRGGEAGYVRGGQVPDVDVGAEAGGGHDGRAAVEEGIEDVGGVVHFLDRGDGLDGRAEDQCWQEDGYAVVGVVGRDVRPDALVGFGFGDAVRDVGVVCGASVFDGQLVRGTGLVKEDGGTGMDERGRED